jgi:hypothetical protein
MLQTLLLHVLTFLFLDNLLNFLYDHVARGADSQVRVNVRTYSLTSYVKPSLTNLPSLRNSGVQTRMYPCSSILLVQPADRP